MNYLKGKCAYLCGGLFSHEDSGISWRDAVTPPLQHMGILVADPCKKILHGELDEIGEDKKVFRSLILKEDWKTLKEKFWPIVRNDLRLVDKSDFLILNYDPSVPTIGTTHEQVVATFEKKVILMKYDRSQLHLFNPWMATFIKPQHFFHDWNIMFEYLRKVNDGVFDTSLWVI